MEGAPEIFPVEADSRGNHKSARYEGTSGVNPKAEGVLFILFRKLGLSAGEAIDRSYRALGFCHGRFTRVPLRLLLAGAAWLSLKTCGERRMQTLRRLEEVSGVPRKLILATEGKLTRVNQAEVILGRSDLEEGWAECSP